MRGLSVLLLVLHVGALTAPRVGSCRELVCADARDIDSDDDSGLDAALPVSVLSWHPPDDARSFPVTEPASLVSCSFVHSPLHVPRA